MIPSACSITFSRRFVLGNSSASRSVRAETGDYEQHAAH